MSTPASSTPPLMTTPAHATTQPPESNAGTITSWLPLTTTFPYDYQGDCSLGFWAPDGMVESKNMAGVAFDPDANYANKCLPTQVTSWWQIGNSSLSNAGVSTVYSLGPLVCPEIYTTAMTSTFGDGRTQIACCPLNYTFVNLLPPSSTPQCTSPLTVGQVILYDEGFVVGSVTVTSSWHMVGAQINGVNFGTNYAPTPTAAPNSSTSSSPTTASSSTSNSTTNSNLPTLSNPSSTTPPSPPNSNSSSNPTSNPSKTTTPTSLIIGTVLGLLILSLLSFVSYLLIRRRRHRAKTPSPPSIKGVKANEEMEDGQWGREWRRELPGWDQKFEMSGEGRRLESRCWW
ncbi:hypothetical protein G7Y89_g4012 [Cudoniella acicularis]|uniref:Uncharacterized protein n=1 Tax=Cudoniella acicularis TaxID=354080 RepID=A0A8H4W4N7_9HELO|nr:hypothetical protein G7Y89_g4012 [Cudoniella acicularis]